MSPKMKPASTRGPSKTIVPSSIKQRVFEYVAERLRRGERVSPTDNTLDGPSAISLKLNIDSKVVRIALATLVEDGWLVRVPITGYVLTDKAPALTIAAKNCFAANSAPHSGLPLPLAEAINAVPSAAELEPESNLEWALHHAGQGLRVFPCVKFLGIPFTEKWFTEASSERSRIVPWWSEYPDADIAAVPDLSGHFVIRLIGETGQERLTELEAEHGEFEPEFRYQNLHGDEHLWFRGRAGSSRTRLGEGIEIIGPGRYVYLPPSLAPDHV